jgi:hypothetical protein
VDAQADQDAQEFVAVADVAVLVGVAWALKIKEYAAKYVGTGPTPGMLAVQPGRRCRCSVGILPDWGGLVLVGLGDGQGEGEGVDLEGEPVGWIDDVAVELDRLGAVTADLHPVSPEGVHVGAGLVAADQDPRRHPDPVPSVRVLSTAMSNCPSSGTASGRIGSPPWILPRLATSTP